MDEYTFDGQFYESKSRVGGIDVPPPYLHRKVLFQSLNLAEQ
jgi:hypothetical protein